ncbi:hypothetical protein KR084_010078, partial [Drosophila pseudotakahashii]
MKLVTDSKLLIAVLWLSFCGGSNGECCTDKAKLIFIMTGGTCGQLNARATSFGCEVTVCGDGKAIVGTFCGKGECNIFGCNCDGGCLHGDYGQSFLALNTGFSIQLMSTEMSTTGADFASL